MVVSVIQSAAGVDNDTVTVQVACSKVGETNLDSQLVSSCSSSCFDDDDLTTTTTLGPTVAGTTYQCTTRVETMCGYDSLSSENFDTSEGEEIRLQRNNYDAHPVCCQVSIIFMIGIPSVPTISVEVSTTGVIITFQTNSGASSFNITVVIAASDGTIVLNQTYTITNYVVNSEREIAINELPRGEFTVTVIATNEYGSSSAAVMQIEYEPTTANSDKGNVDSNSVNNY